MRETFSREEKSKKKIKSAPKQKKKGCTGKDTQEVREEWRRKYALIKIREPSTLFLVVVVEN